MCQAVCKSIYIDNNIYSHIIIICYFYYLHFTKERSGTQRLTTLTNTITLVSGGAWIQPFLSNAKVLSTTAEETRENRSSLCFHDILKHQVLWLLIFLIVEKYT